MTQYMQHKEKLYRTMSIMILFSYTVLFDVLFCQLELQSQVIIMHDTQKESCAFCFQWLYRTKP